MFPKSTSTEASELTGIPRSPINFVACSESSELNKCETSLGEQGPVKQIFKLTPTQSISSTIEYN
jgi:hypothetical protein